MTADVNVLVAGLLSRIAVRKPTRRAGESKQTSTPSQSGVPAPTTVRHSDQEHINVSISAASEADVAREQFPFIFNLLRGHAISTQGGLAGPRTPQAGRVSSADGSRSKTSSPQQHHHQPQQQQQTRKPAVARCRQRPATPPDRRTGTLCTLL